MKHNIFMAMAFTSALMLGALHHAMTLQNLAMTHTLCLTIMLITVVTNRWIP